MAVMARHFRGSDLAAIESLCEVESNILEKHWGPYSLPRLVERSALSCVAVDNNDTVVGFACFHHMPSLGDFSTATWLDEVQAQWDCAYLEDLHPAKTLVLQMFFAEHLHDEEVLNEVIRMALVTFTEVDRIMLVLPSRIPLFAPLIGNFEPLVLREGVEPEQVDVQVLVAQRAEFMGEMIVRPAVVEDHDDLVPIFKAQHPDAEQLGEFFLAQMIQDQNATNKILVAEVQGRAVGLLALTADADLTALQEVYELEPYDFLVQGYVEEAQRVKEAHVAKELRRRTEHAEAIDKVKAEARAQVEEEFEQYLAERQAEEEEEGADAERTAAEEEEAKKKKAEEDEVELVRLIAEAQEDAVAEIGNFEEHPEPEVDLSSLPVNAVCLTLFCLDPALDCQVHKILRPAMEAFSEQEYCLVLLQHEARHSSLMRLMQPVAPRLGQSFSHALYMVHRAALYTPLEVSQGGPDDVAECSEFLEEEADPAVFLNTLRAAPAAPAAAPAGEQVLVARVLGQVVALAKVAPAPQPGIFPGYYELEDLADPGQYAPDEHLELKALVANPIFNNLVPDLICAAQRLTGTCCTYALLPPGQPLPDALKAFPLVPVRRQQEPEVPDDLDPARTALPPLVKMPEGPPCLVHTNYRLLCQRKRDVDARVLVVGGSDTAIAAVEELLAVPYLNFHSVTVLAPGGIPTSPPAFTADSLSFSEPEMRRHLLFARARVIPGEMLALDRVAKTVTARTDDGEELVLSYDRLVLAPGLRDELAARLDEQLRGALGVFAPQDAREEKRLEEFVAREVAPQADVRVCIAGTGVDTVIAAQRLAALGVAPARITVLCLAAEFAPVPGEPRANELIAHAIAEEGITVRCGAAVVSAEGRQQRLAAVTLEDGSVLPCGLLLSLGEAQGVGAALFRALNAQSLVLDGRLVVDAAFKTNDPAISAGGSLVKFARRIRDARRLEQFSAREAGRALGRALLVDLDPDAVHVGRAHAARVPPLEAPLGAAGALPGGLSLVRVWASPALFRAVGGGLEEDVVSELQTEVLEPLSFSRLAIDRYGRVASLCFVAAGPPAPAAWNLAALVGLPVTYLNDIVRRCEVDLVHDIRAFLYQDWARALLHDRFGALREQLEQAANKSENMAAVVQALWQKIKAGDKVASEVGMTETVLTGDAKLTVQDGLNAFLEINAAHLPLYLTAQRAADMQTNNLWASAAERVGRKVGDVPSMDDNLAL